MAMAHCRYRFSFHYHRMFLNSVINCVCNCVWDDEERKIVADGFVGQVGEFFFFFLKKKSRGQSRGVLDQFMMGGFLLFLSP